MTAPSRHPGLARLLRLVAAVLLFTVLGVAGGAPAQAYAPVNIVHTEHVTAGPYEITVGFSTWPIRAMRSLDFAFLPDGGIADKSGTLTQNGPGVKPDDHLTTLVRHPRKTEAWGLDVRAFNAPGSYSFDFAITGPKGPGKGSVSFIVLSQPGPPLAVSWTIGSLPLIGLVAFLGIAWCRVRPGRQPLSL